MKNKVSESGDSVFKKKGFFIALYSCLGAVMVLALVISFTNLTSNPGAGELARDAETQYETANVIADGVDPLDQTALDEQVWKKPTATPKPAATASPTVKPKSQPTTQPSPSVTSQPVPPVPVKPATPAVPNTANQPGSSAMPTQTPSETAAPATPGSPSSPAASEGQDATDEAAEVTAESTQTKDESESGTALAFTPFSENDKLQWPVYGDIAMVFSMDKLVYDPTLNEYRANDDLRITAQEGTPVKACADGQVISIGNNHVYGNYIEVDHGNGWVAQYSQLMDGVLVSEGDIIQSGQVIGGVGKPSYFGSLFGTHVNLRVTKADEPVDPQLLLADHES